MRRLPWHNLLLPSNTQPLSRQLCALLPLAVLWGCLPLVTSWLAFLCTPSFASTIKLLPKDPRPLVHLGNLLLHSQAPNKLSQYLERTHPSLCSTPEACYTAAHNLDSSNVQVVTSFPLPCFSPHFPVFAEH